MDNILLPSEIEFYIEAIEPQNITNIGSKQWLEWHQRLQKLQQQALLEAAQLKEEYVQEALVSYGKVPVLIHEAILINIWKNKILPQILKLITEPSNTFVAYTILYHENVCIALLELILYHETCCEALEDTACDLLDYTYGTASQLISLKIIDEKSNETCRDEMLRHLNNLNFDIGIRSLTIVRYVAQYLDRLPCSVCNQIYNIYDVPMLFIGLLLIKPWIRGKQMYASNQWIDWDGEAVGQAEAQVWFALYQLLLNRSCREYYSVTETRRTQILKLMKLLTPVLLDQLSPLIELKHWLSRICMSELPKAPIPILLETVLEIKEKILQQSKGKWKKIAKEQQPVIFCNNQKVLKDTAQMLSDAYNTDFFEKYETKEKPTCTECGKIANQRCSHCKKSWYCSRACQVNNWPKHKEECMANGTK